MRVHIMTDLEGVAGVVGFGPQAYASGKYYEQAKRLLTAEVNAAVAGLVAEGITEILISDGHGAGGICFEDLQPPARLLHGRPRPPRSAGDPLVGKYDLTMMVGQHAMAGIARANLNHTQNSQAIDHYKLNGRPIGEIAQFALFQGGLDIPMIFLSGDKAACNEAEELIPGVTTVSVKEGVGRNAAISLTAPEARKRIQEGVREAIRKQRAQPLAPVKWEGPYVLEKRFFHTDAADAASGQIGAERVDSQTVRFRAENILDIAYR